VTDSADPDRIEIACYLIMKKTALLKIINLWPSYLGAGVRVMKIAPDFRSIDVEMKLRFWN
jgi:hypothetical protein